MDALDRVMVPAAPLLARTDDLLATVGAPGGHPIWPPVRELGVLPGAAAAAVAALRPVPADVSAVLRDVIDRYDDAAAALTPTGDWAGGAAQAYAARAQALAGQLTGGTGLLDRLVATASYADAVTDWVHAARSALAGTLARVLGSAEAVLVSTAAGAGGTTEALAAAEIGRHVLDTVAAAYDRGRPLLDGGARLVTAVPVRPPAEPTGGPGDDLRVGF